MQVEYKRDMNQNFLVVKAQEVDTTSYQVRMLLGGMVPYLLPAHLTNVDEMQYFHYTVTSKQPVEKVYEDKLFGYEDLFLLFGGFIHVMESMGEYLMNASHLVVDPEYIFVDPQHKNLSFVYLPGQEREIRDQFQRLTEYVLPKLDHRDARAVMLGYGVYRKALEDTFHLEHVKEELYRYREPMPEGEQGPAPEGRQETFPNPGQGEKLPPPPLEDPWENLEEEEGEEGFPFQKIALICGAVVILLLVLAAKLLGYLPGIPLETLLAGFTLLLAIGTLLSYLLGKRPGKKGKEQRKGSPGEGTRWEKKEKDKEEREDGRRPFAGAIEPGERGGKLQRLPSGEKEGREMENREGRLPLPIQTDRREGEAPPFTPPRKGRIRLEEEMEEMEKPKPSPHWEEEEDYGETVALTCFQEKQRASLVSRESGELPTIYLNGDLTVVGKLANAVDALIEMPTVSRVHARIRRREGEYYLTDLNSRNGTSVNGHLLSPEEEWKLEDQDEVDFAKARYLFMKGS